MQRIQRFEVVHGSGGYASLEVHLSKGESVKCEPDAVVSASEHIHIDASMDAGVVRGLLRCLLAGESIFVSVLIASGDDNDALLCPDAPGDIELLLLRNGADLLIAKGSFLAADASVRLETAMLPGFSRGRALFSGTGLFMLHASGSGMLAVNAEGGIVKYTLGAGERRQVPRFAEYWARARMSLRARCCRAVYPLMHRWITATCLRGQRRWSSLSGSRAVAARCAAVGSWRLSSRASPLERASWFTLSARYAVSKPPACAPANSMFETRVCRENCWLHRGSCGCRRTGRPRQCRGGRAAIAGAEARCCRACVSPSLRASG